MKNLILILSTILLTACGAGGGGSETASVDPGVDPGIVNPPPQNNNPPPQGPQTQQVTYYTKSVTEAPIGGWPTKTYTVNGYCTQVNSKTFCWDDGVKTLQWTSGGVPFGPYTYTYFGVQVNPINGNPLSCHGGCADDYVANPTVVTPILNGVIGATVTDVLTHGSANTMTCTVNAPDLVCGGITLAGGA